MVEILVVRCIIPWKVAKRCSKDLEEMLAACAEEYSKFCMSEVRSQKSEVRSQKSDGKSRSQKSDEQKDNKVFRGSYLPRRITVLQES